MKFDSLYAKESSTIYFLIDRLISPLLLPPHLLHIQDQLLFIFTQIFCSLTQSRSTSFIAFCMHFKSEMSFMSQKFQTFEVYSAKEGAPQRDFKLGYGINILHKVPGFLLKTVRSC